MGINDNMIRLSIGIEDLDDIVADFEQALRSIKKQLRVLSRELLAIGDQFKLSQNSL